MPPSVFALVVLLVFSLPLMSASASATTLYTWRNTDGSVMFTDDPKGAPPDVQVHVWAEWDVPQSQPAPESVPNAIAAVPPPMEESPDVVTQGEFAARLVEELGLEDGPDADEATGILTKVRIAPRLGRWEPDEPMTPELTMRLRSLTVAAAAEGWIALTPDEGLLAFDTTAALLGVAIPEAGEADRSSGESGSPIDDMPPLVYLTPPPSEVYPYYLWQPVAGGYWWNGVFVSGIFVLDLGRYGDRHDRHRLKHKYHWDGHTAMTTDRIGHHFREHVTPSHAFKTPPRPHRNPGAPESYGSRGPQRRPSVAFASPTVSQNRIFRTSAPSGGRDRVSRAGQPRASRPGVRTIHPHAFASERAVVSTDGSSHPDGRRIGAGHGKSHGRGFLHSAR